MLKIRNETDYPLHIFILGDSESSEVLKKILGIYEVTHIEAQEVWIGFDANAHKYRNYLGYQDTNPTTIEVFVTGTTDQTLCAKRKNTHQDKTITHECLRFYRIS